jgi:hypothetical protein
MVAAALIAALACPAEPALVERYRAGRVDTRIVACDGARRVVLRRARMVLPQDGPPAGRRITAVDAAGRRLAWGEIRRRAGGRVAGRVLVARLERGRLRVVHRRTVLRRPGGLDVVLTSRGELGWVTRGHVLTATIRGPARVVARNAWSSKLGLEDDRTLRWRRESRAIMRVGYEDLRPWPGRGCPARRAFRRRAAGPMAVVSTAYYSTYGDEKVEAVRLCDQATGADPVVLQLDGLFADYDAFERARVSGPWAVLFSVSVGRYPGCYAARVRVRNALSGARGRGTSFGCERQRMPSGDDPLVVTDCGVPAWIVRSPGRSALLSTGDGLVELDSAGPDGLTGLVADGGTVRWLHDGQPRSAVLD